VFQLTLGVARHLLSVTELAHVRLENWKCVRGLRLQRDLQCVREASSLLFSVTFVCDISYQGIGLEVKVFYTIPFCHNSLCTSVTGSRTPTLCIDCSSLKGGWRAATFVLAVLKGLPSLWECSTTTTSSFRTGWLTSSHRLVLVHRVQRITPYTG